MIKILEKIKAYFNKLFSASKTLMLAENTEENFIEEIVDDNFELEELIEDELSIEEKEEFFEMYKKFNNDEIFLENMLITDMIKMMMVSNEELKLVDTKVKTLENENLKLDEEIIRLQNKQIATTM